MNDDYEEPVVIDEDELDEEVLREMMDEDDREGEELRKKKMAAVFLAGILTSSFLLTGCGNSTYMAYG